MQGRRTEHQTGLHDVAPRQARHNMNNVEANMNRLIRNLSLAGVLAASVAHAAPVAAAPGLLSKFVAQPVIVDPAKSLPGSLAQVNQSDAWWVPAESGWGINVLQQGDALVLMFYVFDDDNLPVWFRGVTTRIADNDFRGTVYLDRGTSYREVQFGPIPQPSQAVGEVRFQPTSLYEAVLTYTIGSTTAAKALARLPFATGEYSGGHSSVVTARINACGEKSGDLSGAVQSEATLNNGYAQLTLSGAGTTCVINGPFRQRGRFGQIEGGTYSCADGSAGEARVDGWDTQGGSFSAIVTTASGSCTESGRIAGVRIR